MFDTTLDHLRRHNTDMLRVHRAAARLYFLGPRVLAEFLAAVAAIVGAQCLLEMLSPFLRLTPDLLRASGGHRVISPPLRHVG